MEPSKAKQTIEIERVVGDESIQMPLRAESMVPGAGREAVEVLMEDATLALGAVEVQSDRVVLDGVIYCQAVYRQGDDPSARAVAAQKTFGHVIEVPGAAASMICRTKGNVDHVEASYENGHMVFQVVLGLRVQVSVLEPVEIITQITGMDGLETQFQEVNSVKLSAEASAAGLLREEVSMPKELDARIALMDWQTVRQTSATPDIGGIRIAGEVQTETLIGTGVPGRPAALVKVALPFDQLVELPEWLINDVTTDVNVKRLTTSLTADGMGEETRLAIEAEMDFAVRASGQDSATALADAYSIQGPLVIPEHKTLTLCGGVSQFGLTEAFKGTLLLPEGAPGIGTILAARVRPNLSAWTVEGGYTIFEGLLEAGVLYLPGGSDRLSSVRGELPFAIRIAEEIAPDAWVQVNASAAEASALMSDRLEFKCVIGVNGMIRKNITYQVVSDVETREAEPRPNGMVLVWPTANDSLWSIGKKYRIPVSEITATNGGMIQTQSGKAVLLRA